MCPIFIVIKFDTPAMHRGTAADKPETWPAVSCRSHSNYTVFLFFVAAASDTESALIVGSLVFKGLLCPGQILWGSLRVLTLSI